MTSHPCGGNQDDEIQLFHVQEVIGNCQTPLKLVGGRVEQINFNIETPGSEKVQLTISTDNISFESTNLTFDKNSLIQNQDSGENGDFHDVVRMLQKIDRSKRHLAEKQIIEQLKRHQSGPKYYLNLTWAINYTNWLNSGKQDLFPTKIDNSALLDDVLKDVRPGLQEKKDFVLVNEISWSILRELYEGAPTIKQRPPTESSKSVSDIMAVNYWSKRQLFDPIGLENSKFYCFMNATLQCLVSIGEFNSYFLEKQHLSITYKTKKKPRFSTAFQALLQMFEKGKRGCYVNAQNFKKLIEKQFQSNE